MQTNIKHFLIALASLLIANLSVSQNSIEGTVQADNEPVLFAKVKLLGTNFQTLTNDQGKFSFINVPSNNYVIEVFSHGHDVFTQNILIPCNSVIIDLKPIHNVQEMVVSGTMKEISKTESTVNVEVFSPTFFKKNPSPSVYDALQNVNGVRPQLNCNICSTGDIHINGLEGPYTMVLIDGMPIVSSLSTVYGLSGIPNSLVERIEIVKGPTSTLYGSEAIGGVINIITKNTSRAPLFSADIFTTSWLENSVDLALKIKPAKRLDILTGINYFNYDLKKDLNQDGFTDVTLQDRISIFQKWNIDRKDKRTFTLAGRYVYEDRWGGEMNWTPEFRGGDSIYGESIYTSRWEILGNYQLPIKEKVFVNLSVNQHKQNSFYGTTAFHATQFIGFGQIYYSKELKNHDLLIGSAVRYVDYDDNTTATEFSDSTGLYNQPSKYTLPGIFIQDEIKLAEYQTLLLGIRYDYHALHGNIFTPRIGYKWDITPTDILRINTGTGYRVANIFTEDHAALTGARNVIIESGLNPEQSYNGNINFFKSILTKKRKYISIDATVFYTYFTNRIIADYDIDPNEIHYTNLKNHAVSSGIGLNLNLNVIRNLKMLLGMTFMDIASFEDGQKKQQILTEKFTGTWTVSYEIPKIKLTIDYTGNLYSPMRLPLLNELDPRNEFSPWWSLQNIQLTHKINQSWECYGGVKNILNWTPNKSTPFLVARSNDPFDKEVSFDNDGNALSTINNPYGLTFDPSYVYAPNQGIRGFIGVRYSLK
jgi:outer membrane receptor for ferrienterochelin and colicins